MRIRGRSVPRSTTARIAAGAALVGAVIAGASAPAFAAASLSHGHPATDTQSRAATRLPVRIGTAIAYVREPNGTIRQVR